MKSTISQEQISKTAVRLGIPDVPFTHRRIARAYNLVETNKVNEVSREDGFYRVHSQYDDKIYTIELNHGNPHCTCPDGVERTVYCKHSIASMMTAQEQKATSLIVKEKTHNDKVKASWVVTDGNEYTNVWQDLNGKICCVCGAYYKRDCIHKQAIRDFYDGGNGSKVVNECGTETAKSLQNELNGNNGTGDIKSPSHNLDVSNPFEESEQLDIDQIEGRSNGDLVHVLSNGKYIISYNGIMKLAEQHKITFEAARHDDTHTVIAQGRCGNNTRMSGKPINGSEMTAVELAKRNVARQLLPLVEIKAMEKKAQLEVEFDWQKAKAACLEIVPDFTFDILLNDLVNDGKLEQKHPSDYNRKEWLVIYNACRHDAKINGNDDDNNGDGDNTPSSDEQVSCAICSRALTNPESVRLQVGPICREKIGIEGEAHLRGNIISDELIEASRLYQDEVLQKRILRACLTLDAPAPVKVLNWLGNEYFGYRNRPILYYFCAAGQLNRIDTSKRKLRHIIVTSATSETELDAHALAQWSTQAKPRLLSRVRSHATSVSPAVDSEPKAARKAFRRKRGRFPAKRDNTASSASHRAEVPDNVDEFVERCKQAEATVDNPTDDNSVDESATAPMVEGAQMDGDDKRKLQMDKNKSILLIEPDGTETPITMRDAAFTYGSNFILRLTQGIACGGDISTVELD